MGVWIETALLDQSKEYQEVTPCVGVWIETQTRKKFPRFYDVTPCVGVWIETSDVDIESYINKCHTLRGCVD